LSGNTGPIADLSYRNYDGPKGLLRFRWWPIALSGLRISLKKKGFWILTLLSAAPYFFLVVMLFFRNIGPRMQEMMPPFSSLLGASYGSGLWPLILALLVGAGSIAADNRANALQVYLSKPITKRDYLFGKWVYIFILVFAVYYAPMLLCTLFYAFSEGVVNFIKSDGVLFLKLIPLAAVPAFIHASVLIGISAWNRTPWLVGVIYAGIYLFTETFSLIFGSTLGSDVAPRAAETVKHLSIAGAISGIGSNVLGVAPRGIGDMHTAELPYFAPLLLIAVLVSLLGIVMASARIRAVEVVQG
jgi:ABC-2 type transport system permease protein